MSGGIGSNAPASKMAGILMVSALALLSHYFLSHLH